jgi:hypothetical protein
MLFLLGWVNPGAWRALTVPVRGSYAKNRSLSSAVGWRVSKKGGVRQMGIGAFVGIALSSGAADAMWRYP